MLKRIKATIGSLFKFMRSDDMTLMEKTYFSVMFCGSSSCFIGALVGLTLQAPVWSYVMYFFAGSVMLFCLMLGYKLNDIKIGTAPAVIMVIGMLFPASYITNDGSKGGTPIWFLLGVIFVTLQTRGLMRVFLWAVTFISYTCCTLVALYKPEWIVPFATPTGDDYDTYFAVVLVSIVIALILILYMKMYETENARAIAQRKEIERLNLAQNNFFSSMSHEIRTPINTIIGLNEMNLREDGISDEILENSTNIQNASRMLLSLINDILDMSKIESGKMDIIPVQYETSSMLSEIVNIIWSQAELKKLDFVINIADDVPTMLFGDEIRIKQVLINILNNAVKYTAEGQVTLSISAKPIDENCCEMCFAVEDTGMGIKKENIPYLFDTFKRVDEQNNRMIEGTGLGLSICNQLVDLMHGSISVDSIYTKGSTFTIRIPQNILDASPIDRSEHALRKNVKRAEYHQSFEAPDARILVVDDNEMNRVVIGKLLRSTRVNVDMALSGKEALEMTLKKHYHVILMDHLMPEMDGIECFRRIRSQDNGLCKDSKVIALTANAGSEMHKYFVGLGFTGYLSKPVSGQVLEMALLRYLPDEVVTYKAENNDSISEESIVSSGINKRPLIICTESVADIPEHLIKKYEIEVIPYYIVTPEGRFQDGLEIDSDDLLAYMSDLSKTVVSEASSVSEYEEVFGRLLSQSVEVIHIAVSSKMGDGYSRSFEAARSFSNVKVVDSGQATSGLGVIAVAAAKMAQEGYSSQEILDMIEDMSPRVQTSFLVDSSIHLYNNGRVGRTLYNLCTLFKVHPILCMKDQRIKPVRILFGSIDKVREKYIRYTLGKADILNKTVYFVSSGCDEDVKDAARKYIHKYADVQTLEDEISSAAISCNSGAGTIGIVYVKPPKDEDAYSL